MYQAFPPFECIGGRKPVEDKCYNTRKNIASAREGICLGITFVYQTNTVKTNNNHKMSFILKIV